MPGVRRITIDEFLENNLARVLIAGLKTKAPEFVDSPSVWSAEKEMYIQPQDYVKKLEIPSSKVKEFPWEKLFEGQTFLQGGFRVITGENKCYRFAVDARKTDFKDIFNLIKDDVKRKYFSALKGSM